MSQLLISISEIPGLSSGARRALVGLISFRNKHTGQCNPGMVSLCERVQAPERCVYRWLAELDGKGVAVGKKRRYGGVCWYEFPTLSALFANPAKNGSIKPATSDSFKPAKNDAAILPLSADYYLSSEQTKKNRNAAASSEVETGRAAAAPKEPEKTTQKPPAREVNGTGFRVVKESLSQLAPLVRLPFPDDDLVWQVIDAGNGASGEEIVEALVAMWKRDALRNMRSWGFIPLKIADLARKAASA